MKRLIPVVFCLFGGIAQAISVTPDGAAAALAAAITGGTGLTITSLTIGGHGAGATASWGTYSNLSGTYSIGPGIVISSGKAGDYSDGPNTTGSKSTGYGVAATAAQAAVLAGISGAASYFDVTEIDIVFDLDATHDKVFFNVTCGSDEYAEFVGTTFKDAFGLLVNGVNVAYACTPLQPVNVDNTCMAPIPGTELDGVLAPGGLPVVTFGTTVGFGTIGNTLKFIIADRSDSIYDSTAYISALGGTPTAPVPEPASLLLLGSALSLAAYTSRKRLARRG